MIKKYHHIFLLILFVSLVPLKAAASFTQQECIECHGDDNNGISIEKYNNSIHGKILSCASCHRDIVDESHMSGDFDSSVDCLFCHSDKADKGSYISRIISFRVSSHKKQDFSESYSRNDCTGCHQGMAVHGETEPINDKTCRQCHMDEGRNALMGRFHSPDKLNAFYIALSIVSQVLIIVFIVFLLRFFITGLFSRSGKRED